MATNIPSSMPSSLQYLATNLYTSVVNFIYVHRPVESPLDIFYILFKLHKYPINIMSTGTVSLMFYLGPISIHAKKWDTFYIFLQIKNLDFIKLKLKYKLSETRFPAHGPLSTNFHISKCIFVEDILVQRFILKKTFFYLWPSSNSLC